MDLDALPSLLGRASMGRLRNGSCRGETGQSLIEFALVVPVLFVMLLGVIFIARGFNLQMVLHAAAYEGARVWASNPSIGSANYCTPPACNPDTGTAINFERYIVPVVRQYVTNNGFDGSKVQFFSKDARAYQNALTLISNDRQLVRVTLLYTIELPIGNFAEGFRSLDVSASCTLKRGS